MGEKPKSNAGGEFFAHKTRPDGTRDLYFGPPGEEEHGHAIIDESGRVKYLRETDDRKVADDDADDKAD